MAESDEAVHVTENRRHWDADALNWVESGAKNWALSEPAWGIWHLPESALGLLPRDMSGLQCIELGCGTGYVSSWLVRRGAAAVYAIDLSSKQLETARALAAKHPQLARSITFVEGDAEHVPQPDGSFDFAISEYGAAIWCDPHVWIPEAHRLLREGGVLVFLGNSPWVSCATPLNGDPTTAALCRPYFGMKLHDWRNVEIDPGGIDFNIPISEWMRLFREVGFEILDFQELQAPADADDGPYSFTSGAWGKKWPTEQVWRLRKVSGPAPASRARK
jgi:SAM-dependent methyltransferase